MALTTLDPRTALIVIDLLKGMQSRPVVHPISEIVERARGLADAFRKRALPVILVNVAGAAPGRTEVPRAAPFPAGWADLLPELGAQPQDHRVTKRTWGAFTGTGLEGYLRSLRVTQVVIVGIATSIGVESTARQAFELGFNVSLATDAMTDVSLEAHQNSVTRIFPRLGETGSTRDFIDLLARTAPGPGAGAPAE
jgi:nicotinamidase-related amidase